MVRIVGAACLSTLLAGCGIFSGPGPTPSPVGGSPTATATASPTPTPTATPTPTPRIVMAVTLVASIGEPKDWTPAGLTWNGIQATAKRIGATTSLVQPVTNADLMADVEQAAIADGAVVVTVGPAADAAVQAAAAAHPKTQFLEMDVAVPGTSPANVHGFVFDEAEAGYLAGFVAASFSGSGKVAMVGDTATDSRSTNYAAGFRSGAAQAAPGIAVAFAYGGSPDLPDRGRTAAAGLVKAGNSVVLAMPSLTGIGAMREACTRKARVVAVETDAWQTVPDIQPCLIVSVVKRYDVAVTAAIEAIASAQTVATVTIDDVADGGLALSDFHADLSAGFQGRLDGLLATLKSGPPRPTPAPPTSSASPSAAPKPSSK
jgi:basic membrane protein A and related proteins